MRRDGSQFAAQGHRDLGAKLNKDMTSSVEITQRAFRDSAGAGTRSAATDADYEGGFDSNVQGWISSGRRWSLILPRGMRRSLVCRAWQLNANDLAKRPAEMKSISLELKQDLAQGPVKELDEDGCCVSR